MCLHATAPRCHGLRAAGMPTAPASLPSIHTAAFVLKVIAATSCHFNTRILYAPCTGLGKLGVRTHGSKASSGVPRPRRPAPRTSVGPMGRTGCGTALLEFRVRPLRSDGTVRTIAARPR